MEGFFQRYLRLYRPLITALNDVMSNYEISYSLWLVIFHIKNNGPSTLVEIASQYNVEKPTITRRVHRLEALQIVEQIPGQDKREKIIQLTPVGEEIYQACRKKITDLEISIMEGITKEEQMIAFDVLPKIHENLLNREGNKIE